MPADARSELDEARRSLGFLTVREVVERIAGRNIVLDPGSLLIGRDARIGQGNVFHAAVEIGADARSTVTIGDGNQFFSTCMLRARAGGRIEIGHGNQFGEGGLVLDADQAGALITIGDHGRYRYGAVIRGRATLGAGSQVLGPVIVEDCELGAGASFAEPDPDLRGGVLKGAGPARHLRVPQGHVIAAWGPFDQAAMQRQSFFHPTPAVDAGA
jgi:carbonic anhydrase/acetyltransferase-like protein (isoleucine patch superfamily)